MNVWQFLQWAISNASQDAGLGLFVGFVVICITVCFLATLIASSLPLQKRK